MKPEILSYVAESGITYRKKSLKPIALGTTAEIFLGEKENSKEEYAIKVFAPGDIFHARAKNEVDKLQRIATVQGAIQIIDSKISEEESIIVTPFMPGSTAMDLFAEPVSHVASMHATLGDILHKVHEKDVIHFDVKPQNVLLSPSPVLIDFGSAIDSTCDASEEGVFIDATPQYLAPEAWLRRFSSKVDVYAAGISFYQLLTGEVPFDDTCDEDASLWEQHAIEPVPSLSDILRDTKSREMSHEIAAYEPVILLALEKDAADRPSAKEWAAMIRDAQVIGKRNEEVSPTSTEYSRNDFSNSTTVFSPEK